MSKNIKSSATNAVTVENTLNREGDILPFGYYDPVSKLRWVCNYGIEGSEIISVFVAKTDVEGKEEKQIKYLKDLDEAKFCKKELIANGWLPIKLPKIEIKI
jgi:hypothetical protein